MNDHSTAPHHSPKYSRIARFALLPLMLVGLMVLSVAPLFAGDVKTWTGTVDGNWNNGGNWSLAGIPAPDDHLVFPFDASALRPNTVNNLGPYALSSITIRGPYTISSSTVLTTPTINASASATIAAPLGMPGPGLITIIQETGSATLTLSGIISGTGGVTVGGPGITQFTGSQANTYTGLTTVMTTTTGGALRLARSAEAIPSDLTITATGRVIIDAGSSQINYASLVTVNGTLNLEQASGLDSGTDNETIGGLAGIGLVELGARRLGCYLSPTNPTFSGVLVGTVASSLRKHGLFTQKLSGTSAGFEGTSVVNGSALTILGKQVNSNITANEGTVLLAQLAEVGSISMSGTSNLSIGNEPGVQNQAFSKSLTLTSTSRLDVFSGSTAGHSRLNVVGGVVLGNAGLTVNTDTAPPGSTTPIVIIDNDGTLDGVSGIFASLPQGAEVTSSGATPVTFTVSYSGGDGNDVTLTPVLTPTSTRPAITSASTATGTVGTGFAYAITATNSPTSYSASNLPAGLVIDTTTGAISGTPTIAGSKSVLLTATNASGSGSGAVTITISPAAGGGGTPAPPGPAATISTGGGSSGCGSGGAVAVLTLMLMLSLTLIGERRRR